MEFNKGITKAKEILETFTNERSTSADLDPFLLPLSKQDFDLASVDIVVNTHLHFDHCGGNHLFTGRPIYVLRLELDDARSQDGYTIREWVDAPNVRYIPVDGELDDPHTEGQLRVRTLDPELVWLADEHEPWRLRHAT